jgi:hypothetical protein
MLNLFPYIIVWAVLAAVVLGLYIYRRSIARQEDETLHVLDSEVAQISQQAVVARKLEVVDRWGKTFTVLVLLYSLVLAAVYFYGVWQSSTKVMMD